MDKKNTINEIVKHVMYVGASYPPQKIRSGIKMSTHNAKSSNELSR